MSDENDAPEGELTYENVPIQLYCRSLGLASERVLAEGWNRDGYWLVSLDSDGTPLLKDGEIVVTWQEWPEGANFALIEYLCSLAGLAPSADLPGRSVDE